MIRATGEAAVSARADQATLRLAVSSSGVSSKRAGEKNAERTTLLIARLRELLGKDANIRTVDYTSSNYPGMGKSANHAIEVRVQDPELAGKVIDVAAKLGASVVGGVKPSVLDEQNARSEALKQATARARANAEAIASALGLRVARIVSAETLAPAAKPPIWSGGLPMAVMQERETTPIEAGTTEVRVQVAVTLEATP